MKESLVLPLRKLSQFNTEKDYRDANIISYSLLSSVDEYGPKVAGIDFNGNKGTEMGQCIEDMVFGVHDESKYHVSDIIEPGAVLKEAIDAVYQVIGSNEFNIFEKGEHGLKRLFKVVLEAYPNIGYYQNMGVDKRIDKMFAEAESYIHHLSQMNNKIVFTHDEYTTCLKCAESLRKHSYTAGIFDVQEDCEAETQFKMTFPYNLDSNTTVLIKLMVDWLKINHREKHIYPFDLKTGIGSPLTFQYTYHKRRYDIQDFIYSLGVSEYLREFYPDYVIHPLTFVYISTTDPDYRPVVWRGLGAFPLIRRGYSINTKEYSGVDDLIREYLFYQETNFTAVYPRKVVENNGVLELSTKFMNRL